MTRDWTESQVTWNIAQTGTNWTTAGGDYNGTATISTTTGTTNNVSLTWNIQADVQAWVNGTSNYGTLIKDGTESSGTARTATFASEENATSANRPQLVIDYTAPFTATLRIAKMKLATIFRTVAGTTVVAMSLGAAQGLAQQPDRRSAARCGTSR